MLAEIKASKNFIADVDEEAIESHENLEKINLEGNPLTQDCYTKLGYVSKLKVILSERKYEEWEDLSIWSMIETELETPSNLIGKYHLFCDLCIFIQMLFHVYIIYS